MVNVIDIDAAITRLATLLGIPYDAARMMVLRGPVTYSIPVTDTNIQVNASITQAFNKGSSSQTIVCKTLQKTATADTAYTIHTVTTGKTLYIKSITVGGTQGTNYRVGPDLSGAAFTDGNNESNTQCGCYVTNGQNIHQPDGTMKLTSAQVLKIVVGTNNNINVTINGWEE